MWFVTAGATSVDSCFAGWPCRAGAATRLEGLGCRAVVQEGACVCAGCLAGIFVHTFLSACMGAPRTVRPCCSAGKFLFPTHVAGPKVSVSGGWRPPRFQTRALPWLSLMRACVSRR